MNKKVVDLFLNGSRNIAVGYLLTQDIDLTFDVHIRSSLSSTVLDYFFGFVSLKYLTFL